TARAVFEKIFIAFWFEMREGGYALTHSEPTVYRPSRIVGHPPGHPMDHPVGHPWDTRETLFFHENCPNWLQVPHPQLLTAVDTPVDGPWTPRGRPVDARWTGNDSAKIRTRPKALYLRPGTLNLEL